MKACSIDGCGRIHRARGYCSTHISVTDELVMRMQEWRLRAERAEARVKELEDEVATALTERLRLAEAVCEAADSVSSEPDVSDLHSCYNMGVELGQRLAAWRKVKIEP